MLGLTPSTANGAEVCIALRANGACPTLPNFCYGDICKYAIFGNQNKCCATDFAPGGAKGYTRR
jgi:hypothetical protein